MTRRRKKPLKNGRGAARSVPPFPIEFRIKVARLYIEDGYPAKLVASQFGISEYSVYRWGKNYRLYGEQGLVDRPKAQIGSKLPASVSQSIVDLKKENPSYGARRITDILKRFFWVRPSASTVQRTLRAQGLSQPVKRKPEKNPAKPRFFERARPNQVSGLYFILHYSEASNRAEHKVELILLSQILWGFFHTMNKNTYSLL